MATAQKLFPLLKEVSRSFYLTLRVLPASVRPQIGVAYLLARATDTIADTELVPVEERLAALSALRARILGERTERVDLRIIAVSQPDLPKRGDAEAVLLGRIEEVVGCLDEFSKPDQASIRDVVNTITSGQELDLRRFGNAAAGNIMALQTDNELDDYTYRVAGCVGEFWTKMCRAHVFPKARIDDEFLLRNGVRFGKGLQLVNILRDLPRDLVHGRCYLPAERLARVGLQASDLRTPAIESRLRPVYNELLDLSEAHLRAGWEYTNALPRSAMRVRLACAWPILIGVRTLAQLRTHNPLDGARRVKVTRADVRRVMTSSVLRYPFAASWRALFDAHRNAHTSRSRR